uniref:Si:dkeyp-104b3.18 n=1 Tax=Cyprinus carpio TaxID=7962 RepID=A0A8C1YTG0_CYPCA
MASYTKINIFYISVGFWLSLGESIILCCVCLKWILFIIFEMTHSVLFMVFYVKTELIKNRFNINHERNNGLCVCLGVECFDGGFNHTLTVQTGGSVTIPCYYDKKYTQQKKYWFSEIDKTFKNTSEENLSVIDHSDQSLFTVTMRNLQNKHSGPYYCIVETGEQPSKKTIYETYLKIQSAPGVSVVSSSVSGHEGGDISVQCVYSSDYQNKLKQWCRYKDQSCYTVGRTDTSQNPSVQISDDDGGRSFTVLMTGLRLTDSGWYFCSAGQAMNPVHLTVTEAEPQKGKDTSVFKHFSLTSLLSELFCICLLFVVMHSISSASFAFHSNNHFLIAFVILLLCVFLSLQK